MTVAAGRYSVNNLAPAFPYAGGDLAISVCAVGTTTLATLYADKISGITAPNPVTTDTLGGLTFFAPPGDYDLVWQTGSAPWRVTVTVRPDPTNPIQSAGGVTIRSGTGAPSVIAGAVGDLYIRDNGAGAANSNIYYCTAASTTTATYGGIA